MSHCLKRLKTFHAILPSLFALLLLSLTTAQSLLAQAGGASISGEISDKSGAVIRGAEVDITNRETNIKLVTMSNNAGVYNFPSLPPGNYVLSVHKQGFRSVDLPDLTVYTQDNLERNFVLEVGSVSESVMVNSGVSNDSPAVSMTVNREFVEDTPLNGRSFQDLIQLAPGAVSTLAGEYSIDGQRSDSNIFTVDGVSANLGGALNDTSGGAGLGGYAPMQTVLGTTQSITSIDTLQEFKIQTSGYTAEYGRSPGGQVQFTTRSGTNSLRGSIYDYFRNTILDANSDSNDYYGDPKSAEHQNDFGGTLSGPLTIPKFYNGANRTFYFLSYEGLRLLLPASESKYVPTQAFRNSASSSVQPYLDVSPFPNTSSTVNKDGCTVLDPDSGKQDACDALFYYGYSYPNKLDSISGRLDTNLGERSHAFIRYADTPSSTVLGAESVEAESINARSLTVGLTSNLTDSLVNEVRLNYTRDQENNLTSERSIGGSTPVPRSLLIPSSSDSPYSQGFVIIYVPGTSLITENGFEGNGSLQHQYQFVDGLTLVRGKHSFKFGADWRRLLPTYRQFPYSNTVEILSLDAIKQGFASSVNIGITESTEPIFDNLSLYAQDHWKLTTRFSADYGMRWEFNPPPGPANGLYPAVLTSSDLATATLAAFGNKPWKPLYDKFAPRFGFAWNALTFPSYSLTIRGGFGIFYDTGQSQIGEAYAGSYPFSISKPNQSDVSLPLSPSVLAPPSSSLTLSPPYPYQGSISSPNLTLPYTEQWGVSIDQALRPTNTLTLSYVGNAGRKLLYSQSFAGSPYGNQNFPSGMNFVSNGSQSSYNSLQVQDMGKIYRDLDVIASFTYAHALDNASNDASSYFPEWGNSNYDLRRVLNLALNYSTGTSGKHGMWTGWLKNGWAITNRLSAQSGYPLDIVQSYSVLPEAQQDEYRPDRVANVPIYLHGRAADFGGLPVPANWRLNPMAFAFVPLGSDGYTPVRQGSLGRNYVRTPSFWALNTSLQRSFPLYDRLHLNFRVEAFNLLNHPNLCTPDSTLTSSTFGQLFGGETSTIGSSNPLYGMGAARSLQLSLKLQF